ncbi:hypothetical protein BDB00DRAFT_191218 [Zychaea mexicana]|uniref:uncharacterized protein n=1 Tax=Zychaea mexicana TaxID=64656 RepID=UPI0022FEBC19|nr:uncharacterized protein BDB00DRAFT_191218 [Zychaea mexicana]KAI9477092.1 hypothetical protein BDB00DRAFT_191218 [Zychaea mexicana]
MSSNSNVMLTHLQAACVFYGEDISPENELRNEAEIDALDNLELCYSNNPPIEPFLLSAGRIKYFPFRCCKYRRSAEGSISSAANQEKDVIEIDNDSNSNQVIHNESRLKEFVDNVFLTMDPLNEKVYECIELSTEQIFQLTKQYTTLFQDKQLIKLYCFCQENQSSVFESKDFKKTNQ